MTSYLGTGIFWMTLASVAGILSCATVLGRAWSRLLPYRLKSHARFYLAPALGLASLTIIASLLGRLMPLGTSAIVPCLITVLLFLALALERQLGQAFRHALTISIFGIVCGASILGALYVYGGFNSHNDAFTYLAHSDWLQTHAFGAAIPAEMVTPLTSQISMYQRAGFRMGGSFLLALFQSLTNLRWAYEIYPAVVIASLAASCLAIGFPVAQTLRPMRREIRLILLVLPALSLGGLVFGANLGFLPQTVGLALGASFLFVVGPLFRWIVENDVRCGLIGRAALPSAVLLTAATFAYSELVPFLLLAIWGSGFILAWRFRAWGKLFIYVAASLCISAILLNVELLRAYNALRTQSGAIVGTPVEWTLLGYIAHAFGVHGGAWDGFQWTGPGNFRPLTFDFGLILLSLMIGALIVGRRTLWATIIDGTLMPVVALLAIFAAGIVYFRYFVPSPFPRGLGQSWSQFKLADWAHPFTMVLMILAIAVLRLKMSKFFEFAVLSMFAAGLLNAVYHGIARTTPISNYYGGSNDLNRFYLDFRRAVLANCSSDSPVFLELGGEDHKFRQMAALYLYDREIRSDWTDDGYIFPLLSNSKRQQQLTTNSCVVERRGQDSWLRNGNIVGPFQIGQFNGNGRIKIMSLSGAYNRESDEKNWWYWVERKITFKLQAQFVEGKNFRSKLYFEYGTRGKQILTLHIVSYDGLTQKILLPSNNDSIAAPLIFDKIIDMPLSQLAEIVIETDGKASPLGAQDNRMAAWIIRNPKVTLVK